MFRNKSPVHIWFAPVIQIRLRIIVGICSCEVGLVEKFERCSFASHICKCGSFPARFSLGNFCDFLRYVARFPKNIAAHSYVDAVDARFRDVSASESTRNVSAARTPKCLSRSYIFKFSGESRHALGPPSRRPRRWFETPGRTTPISEHNAPWSGGPPCRICHFSDANRYVRTFGGRCWGAGRPYARPGCSWA